MKIEIEHTYRDEFRKLQEEYDGKTEKNKEVIKLESEKKFVEELRKVGAFASFFANMIIISDYLRYKLAIG